MSRLTAGNPGGGKEGSPLRLGIVVNETMAAGLPVVVSDEVGAAPNPLRGRGTGIVYPCGDVGSLARGMQRLLESAALRQEMGEKARSVIQEWGLEACVAGMASAAAEVSGIYGNNSIQPGSKFPGDKT